MTITRYLVETQRAVVERVLRDEGSISAFDAAYRMAYTDGRPCGITRLAAVIHTLRGEGWPIAERAERGQLAVYTLGGPTAPATAPQARPEPPRPAAHPEPGAWMREWRCTTCGGRPQTQPEALLGGMGAAHCGDCAKRRVFRRV